MRNAVLALAAMLAAVPCFGRIITVDDDGPADYSTIQAAIDGIDVARDGRTIEVRPGRYRGEGNQNIDFLGKAITVRSTDPNDFDIVAATIIDCNSGDLEVQRGFVFASGEDAPR